ncbi:hypothetical protein Lal_00047560 [Lupinus albus]|nr:hypothetical protein Lal_00047560 [Lupinus albus]
MVTTSAFCPSIETWYLDSGCSNYMIRHREWLVDFESSKRSRVKFANDSSLKVEGAGNVVITRENGSKATISNVLLVPDMKCNLLSIGQLVEKCFIVIIKNIKNGQLEYLILRRNQSSEAN